MRSLPSTALSSLILIAAACSSGGDGGGGGAGTPAPGTLTPWAISAAGNSGAASNLLQVGDRFAATTDPAQASAEWDQIWAVLVSVPTWVGENPLYTFQFFTDTDPLTHWGRAFRYTGFEVWAGPVRTPAAIHGPGIYTSATGSTHPAMICQTWDDSAWQIVIIADARTFVYAHQHFNGLPVVEYFRP